MFSLIDAFVLCLKGHHLLSVYFFLYHRSVVHMIHLYNVIDSAFFFNFKVLLIVESIGHCRFYYRIPLYIIKKLVFYVGFIKYWKIVIIYHINHYFVLFHWAELKTCKISWWDENNVNVLYERKYLKKNWIELVEHFNIGYSNSRIMCSVDKRMCSI